MTEDATGNVNRLARFHLLTGRMTIVRAGLTWIALHGLLFLASGGTAGLLAFQASLVFVAIVGIIVRLIARQQDENHFLSNLGVSPLQVPLTAIAVAGFLEIAQHLIAASS